MVVTFPRSADRRAGFTLLEVLVTIALIALLTGALVIGTSRLLGDRPKSPAELFWAAVGQARKTALLQNQSVRFSFDTKTHEFVGLAAGAETRWPFVPKETAEIDFLPPKSSGGSAMMLIAGEAVESQTMPAITFYGDGTCSPFRAQLKTRTQVRVLEIDPWTCAAMLASTSAR